MNYLNPCYNNTDYDSEDKIQYLNLNDNSGGNNEEVDEQRVSSQRIENQVLQQIMESISNEYSNLDFNEIKDNFSHMLKKILEDITKTLDNSSNSVKLRGLLKKYLAVIMEIFVGFADQMNKKSSFTLDVMKSGFLTIDNLIRRTDGDYQGNLIVTKKKDNFLENSIIPLLNSLSSEIKLLIRNSKIHIQPVKESIDKLTSVITSSKSYLVDVNNTLASSTLSSNSLAQVNSKTKSVISTTQAGTTAKVIEKLVRDKINRISDNLELLNANKGFILTGVKSLEDNFNGFFEEAKKIFKDLKNVHNSYMANDTTETIQIENTNILSKDFKQNLNSSSNFQQPKSRSNSKQSKSKSLGKNLTQGRQDEQSLEIFIKGLKEENLLIKKKYLEVNNEFQNFKAKIMLTGEDDKERSKSRDKSKSRGDADSYSIMPEVNKSSYNNLSLNKQSNISGFKGIQGDLSYEKEIQNDGDDRNFKKRIKTELIRKDTKSSNQLYKINQDPTRATQDNSRATLSRSKGKLTSSNSKLTTNNSRSKPKTNNYVTSKTPTNQHDVSGSASQDNDLLKEPQPQQYYFDTEINSNNKKTLENDRSKEKNLLQSEITNLRAEISKLRKSKAVTNEAVFDSTLNKVNVHNKYEDTIKLLNDEVNSMKKHNDKLKLELQRVLNENTELLNQKDELRKKEINCNEIQRKHLILIDSLKKEIEELKKKPSEDECPEKGEKEDYKEPYNRLIIDYNNLKTEKSKLSKQYLSLESSNKTLLEELDKVRKTSEGVESEVVKLQESKEKKKRKLLEQTSLNDDLLNIISKKDIEINESIEERDKIQQELELVLEKNKKLVKDLEYAKNSKISEIKVLEKDVKEEDLKNKQIEELTKDLANAKTYSNKLKTEKDLISKTVQVIKTEQEKEIEKLKKQLTAELNKKDAEMQQLNKKYDELVISFDIEKDNVRILKEINDKYSKIDDVNEKVEEQMKEQEDQFNSKLLIIEEEMAEKDVEIKRLEQVIIETEAQIKLNLDSLVSERRLKDELKENNIKLTEKIDELENELAEAKERINILEEKCESFEEISKMAEKNETDLGKQVKLQIEEITHLKHTCTDMRGKLEESQSSFEKVEGELTKQQQNFKGLLENENVKLNAVKVELQSKAEENNNLKSKVSTLENKLIEKENEVTAAQEELKECKSLMQDYTTKTQENELKITSLLKTLEEKVSMISLLESQKEDLLEQISKTEINGNEKVNLILSLEQQVDEREKTIVEIEKVLKEQKNTILSTDSQLTEVNEKSRLLEKKLEEKSRKIDMLDSELMNTTENLLVAHKENTQLSDKLKNLEKDFSQVLQEKNDLEVSLDKAIKQYSNIQEENQQQTVRLGGMEKIKEELNAVLTTRDDLTKQVKKLTTEKGELEVRLENLKLDNKKLNTNLEEEWEKVNQLSQLVDEMKNKIDELTNSNSHKMSEISELSDSLDKKTQLLEQLEEKLTKSLADQERKIDQLTKKHESDIKDILSKEDLLSKGQELLNQRERSISDLESEKNGLSKLVELKEEAIIELETKVEQKNKEIQAKEKLLQDVFNQLRESENEKKSLKTTSEKQLINLQDVNSNLLKRSESLQIDKSNLNTCLSEYEKKVEKLLEEYSALAEERNTLKNEVESLINLKQLSLILENERDNLSSQLKESEEIVKHLKADSLKQGERIEKLNKGIEDLEIKESKLQILVENLEKINIENGANIVELEEKNTTLTKEINQIKEISIEEQGAIKSAYQSKITALEKELQDTHLEVSKLKAELTDYELDFEKKGEEISSRVEREFELQKSNKFLEGQIEELHSKISNLKNEGEKGEIKISSLKTSESELRQKLGSFEKQVKELVNTIQRLELSQSEESIKTSQIIEQCEEEKNALKGEVITLQKTLDEANEKIEKLNADLKEKSILISSGEETLNSFKEAANNSKENLAKIVEDYEEKKKLLVTKEENLLAVKETLRMSQSSNSIHIDLISNLVIAVRNLGKFLISSEERPDFTNKMLSFLGKVSDLSEIDEENPLSEEQLEDAKKNLSFVFDLFKETYKQLKADSSKLVEELDKRLSCELLTLTFDTMKEIEKSILEKFNIEINNEQISSNELDLEERLKYHSLIVNSIIENYYSQTLEITEQQKETEKNEQKLREEVSEYNAFKETFSEYVVFFNQVLESIGIKIESEDNSIEDNPIEFLKFGLNEIIEIVNSHKTVEKKTIDDFPLEVQDEERFKAALGINYYNNMFYLLKENMTIQDNSSIKSFKWIKALDGEQYEKTSDYEELNVLEVFKEKESLSHLDESQAKLKKVIVELEGKIIAKDNELKDIEKKNNEVCVYLQEKHKNEINLVSENYKNILDDKNKELKILQEKFSELINEVESIKSERNINTESLKSIKENYEKRIAKMEDTDEQKNKLMEELVERYNDVTKENISNFQSCNNFLKNLKILQDLEVKEDDEEAGVIVNWENLFMEVDEEVKNVNNFIEKLKSTIENNNVEMTIRTNNKLVTDRDPDEQTINIKKYYEDCSTIIYSSIHKYAPDLVLNEGEEDYLSAPEILKKFLAQIEKEIQDKTDLANTYKTYMIEYQEKLDLVMKNQEKGEQEHEETFFQINNKFDPDDFKIIREYKIQEINMTWFLLVPKSLQGEISHKDFFWIHDENLIDDNYEKDYSIFGENTSTAHGTIKEGVRHKGSENDDRLYQLEKKCETLKEENKKLIEKLNQSSREDIVPKQKYDMLLLLYNQEKAKNVDMKISNIQQGKQGKTPVKDSALDVNNKSHNNINIKRPGLFDLGEFEEELGDDIKTPQDKEKEMNLEGNAAFVEEIEHLNEVIARMEESEQLLVDQLSHLKDELKETRNQRDQFRSKLEELYAKDGQEIKLIIKPAFIKLINEILWNEKMRELIVVILNALDFSNEDINKLVNLKCPKKKAGLFGMFS